MRSVVARGRVVCGKRGARALACGGRRASSAVCRSRARLRASSAALARVPCALPRARGTYLNSYLIESKRNRLID